MLVNIIAYSVSVMIDSLSVRYRVDSFTPCLLYHQEKSHKYPLNRRHCEP